MSADANVLSLEIEELEDQRDALAAMLARVEAANEERVPFAVVKRLSACEPPVRVWREHRGMSAQTLSERSGVTFDMIQALERGHEGVGLGQMASISGVLAVDLNLLVPWTEEGRPARFRD